MADVTLGLTGIALSASTGGVTSARTRALTGSGVSSGRGTVKYNTVGVLTGRGFTTLVSISGVPVTSAVTGGTFATAAEIYQAALVTGSVFSTTPVISVLANNESFLIGGGFNSELIAVASPVISASVSGRGFKTSPIQIGAAVTSGRGFGTYPVLSGTAPTFAGLTGRGFATAFLSSGAGYVSARVTGRGLRSSLGHSGLLTGRGFSTSLKASLQESGVFTSAFVMNIATKQVSRYTNFPFSNIVIVNSKYYGVKPDGFYLLEGQDDTGFEIVGSITTKDDDFDSMQSKNVPFIYLGCDDTDIAVTPIVDDYTYPTYIEDFDGRKVKMARGIKGRYWRFRIDKIKKLQALETIQETLGRRVK